MALGLKVLAVLFAALLVVMAVIVYRSNPQAQGMFRCFFNVEECMTNGSAGLTTSKMISAMSFGTWQASERKGFF
jgi:hypothetical protein